MSDNQDKSNSGYDNSSGYGNDAGYCSDAGYSSTSDVFSFTEDDTTTADAKNSSDTSAAKSETATDDSGMRACPEKLADIKDDPNWISYDEIGNPDVFHCGYEGFIEAEEKEPGSLTNECFYDELGHLVDEDHPYADCGGTPDEYVPNSLVNKVKHTFIDKGGIFRSGPAAFIESRKHDLDELGNTIREGINNFENAVLDHFYPGLRNMVR
jgi:hypothetical protein